MFLESLKAGMRNELIDSYICGLYDGINTVNDKLKKSGIDYKFETLTKKELIKLYLKKEKGGTK